MNPDDIRIMNKKINTIESILGLIFSFLMENFIFEYNEQKGSCKIKNLFYIIVE